MSGRAHLDYTTFWGDGHVPSAENAWGDARERLDVPVLLWLGEARQVRFLGDAQRF